MAVNNAERSEQIDGDVKSEIPEFDLAEEIMAEQRRITAIKRKPPGKALVSQQRHCRESENETQNLRPQAKSVSYTIDQPAPSEQAKIIAEIVARDIESLIR